MKKVVMFILGLLLVISGTTIISYNILASGKEVNKIDDILSVQASKEKYFNCYGYSFDNPNVIVNPYDISSLSALVMFEDSNITDIEVTISGKDNVNNISYIVKGDKCNYIPIYGLYSNYDNKVTIKSGNRIKELNIKTDEIDNIDNNINSGDKDLLFVDKDDYVYAVDKNGDIRWYINNYGGKIESIDNGHFLLHSNRRISNEFYDGFVEIDMLGKIYYDYHIDKGGYKNSYIKKDNSVYIVSNKSINYVSLLNGNILKSYKVKDKCEYIDLNDNKIICSNSSNSISIDIDSNKIKDIDNSFNSNREYYNDINNLGNYKKIKGVRFGNYSKTKTYKKNIWLFNYKELKKKNIEMYKEFDRLVINGDFTDNSYVILDGIRGKKIYKIDKDNNNYYKYIYYKDIKGKYNIYFQIDNILYKSNYYVKF